MGGEDEVVLEDGPAIEATPEPASPKSLGEALQLWVEMTGVEFYNEYRQLVWACRGVQSGQFADQSRCAYKVKADTRWPSLEALR